jgi:hypothetical protein
MKFSNVISPAIRLAVTEAAALIEPGSRIVDVRSLVRKADLSYLHHKILHVAEGNLRNGDGILRGSLGEALNLAQIDSFNRSQEEYHADKWRHDNEVSTVSQCRIIMETVDGRTNSCPSRTVAYGLCGTHMPPCLGCGIVPGVSKYCLCADCDQRWISNSAGPGSTKLKVYLKILRDEGFTEAKANTLFVTKEAFLSLLRHYQNAPHEMKDCAQEMR